jgi:GNAT superfamily N-acetyltransferase
MWNEMGFALRARGEGDLEACVAALAAVHAADQYPFLWPTDPAAWLTPDHLLAAWVVVDGGRAVGHVALCAMPDEVKARWPLPDGTESKPLAEVCRLFVAPEGRGRGLGARLLATATAAARARGYRPALRVTDYNRAAIALYERAGWRRVASETKPWEVPDPAMTVLHSYVAPD